MECRRHFDPAEGKIKGTTDMHRVARQPLFPEIMAQFKVRHYYCSRSESNLFRITDMVTVAVGNEDKIHLIERFRR